MPAVYACLLAECGVEGAVRPFEGQSGFLAKYARGADNASVLLTHLDPRHPLGRINSVVFKRWPVGSRGQSAIQAALEARAKVKDAWRVKQVRVFSDDAAFDHLVRRREDPMHPRSRETADHSLPYIVAAAVLDGFVKVESFDRRRRRQNPSWRGESAARPSGSAVFRRGFRTEAGRERLAAFRHGTCCTDYAGGVVDRQGRWLA